ncbi:MAG: hypothetical protein U0746_06805 [Gemmataceae bacterium]
MRASASEMASLHKEPMPGCDVPPTATKYADDQAIAGIAAVFRAIRATGQPVAAFADWSVVAAPRFLGRWDTDAALDRYERRGAPSVSARNVPYMSLHAVAGAVSLALGSHGTNIGAGGGPGSLAEGLLAGLTICAEGSTPGVWVVLTEWNPEPIVPDDPASVCHAVALGLTSSAQGIRLERGDGPTTSVAALGRFLENDLATAWECALGGGWRLALTKRAAEVARAA